VQQVLQDHARAGERAAAAIRILYCFPLYWYATHLDELRPLLAPAEPTLLWPVAWLAWVDPSTGAAMILGLGFGSALLGVALPERRWVRALVFLGLLEVLALKFSFGKVHHLMHGWLFPTFVLVALPDGWSRAEGPGRGRQTRQATLFTFAAAQMAVAMTYSLAGLGKILGTGFQAAQGQITPLHPEALARHLADRILQTHADSLLGPWMIDHATWLWPLMLGTVYLQLFALQAAFRPRLHRWWAVGLMGFHAVSVLSLTIDFNPNILLVGILFAASPNGPRGWELRETLRDLPLLGYAFCARSRWLARASSMQRNRNSNASSA
jgi:hypothetical protein